MIEISRVLCPVDFSDFSRRTLDHAVALARWYRSHLTVLYVHRVEVPFITQLSGVDATSIESARLSRADRDAIRTELHALVGAAAAAGVGVACEVADGDVVREILAAAESCDLLVMGTHGRSGFERLLLGSVAEKVLRKAMCPVLTVPPVSDDAVGAVPALFHHIVAAVDFSDASMAALAFARSLAEEADAHLTVLHVTEIPRPLQRWADEDPEGRKHVEQWKAYARDRMHSVVPDTVREYCHVEDRVETGVPYRAILEVAAAQQAGLIVIGRHSQSVVERAFVGSTAQHVVREAACPVLTVRGRRSI